MVRSIIARLCACALVIADTVAVHGLSAATAQGAFDRASDGEISGPVGSLIREEPGVGAAAGASAHKILYRSTDPNGRPIAVSGIVIVPKGPTTAIAAEW